MKKRLFLLKIIPFFIFIIAFNTLPVRGITPTDQSFLTPTPTIQVDYALPYPGILPDHPLYFFKKIRDKILIFFTRDPVRRSEVLLLISDKKIQMAQLLLEKEEFDLSTETFLEAEGDLLRSVAQLEKLKDEKEIPVGYTDKVELASKKHLELLNSMASSAKEQLYIDKVTETLLINESARAKLAELEL